MILKEIKDEGNSPAYILITGFRDVIIDYKKNESYVKKISEKRQVTIQFFNADLIASWEHLYFSILHSIKSFKQGRNLSSNLDLEILLYASGQRQIKVAIKELGIGLEIKNIALIIYGNSVDNVKNALNDIQKLANGKDDDSILNIDEEKYKNICNFFNIHPIEIQAIINSNKWEDKLLALIKIILNRIAFVVFEK